MNRTITPVRMTRRILSASIVSLLGLSGAVQAATFTKANNTNDLNLGTSWVAGSLPGASDIALWDSTVTGANSVLLGGNLSWKGIAITNPGGPVTVGGANTLTLGTSGIDMSAATQDLTISSGLAIGTGNQVWNLATGRTLTLNTGTFTRSAGATLNIQGSGTVAASMTGLANDNSTGGGILGPWASVGSGASTQYATLSGGNIVGYTGATVATAFGWTSTNPATQNYEVTGVQGALGVSRTANTVRYTGAAGTQTWGTNDTQVTLTLNGLMNAGTGTLTFARGGTNTATGLQIGASKDLVLHAANAGITISTVIANNSGGASSLTVVGPNTVTLSGTNTYTGGTFVNSGRLIAPTRGMNGGPINIASGATLTFTDHNQPSTSTVTGSGAIVNDTANTIIFTGDHTGFTGTLTHSAASNNTQFNTALSGSQNATYNLTAGEFIFAGTGDYTVKMGSLSGASGSIVRTTGTTSNAGTVTLEVGSLGASTSVFSNLNNGAASGGKVLALTKVGSGTLSLGGTSNYTGATLVSGGTLAVSGTGSINNSSGITVNGSGAKLLYTSSVAGTSAITLAQGTLDGTGMVGPVTVANNASNIITNGNGGGSALTLFSAAFQGAATMNINMAGAPGVVVLDSLTTTPANGQVTINGSGIWANGLNSLISFGSFTGSIGDFTKGAFTGLSGRQTAGALQLSGNNIALNVIGDTPVWTGANGGIWRQVAQGSATSATPAWKLQTAGTATDFWVGDNAVFDDSATGTTTATISGGNVSPNSLIFNNSTKSYTITSSDGSGIAAGSLIKNELGNLTINTANTFAGGTTINGGKITAGTATALGTGAVTLNGGNLDLGGQSLANAVVLTMGDVQGNGTLSGNVSGAGMLMRFSGTLTLAGNNTYSGGTSLDGGTLNINSASALGTGLVLINGGTLNNTSGSAKTLTTNNAQTWSGDFTFTGASDLDMGSGTVTLSNFSGDNTVTVTANTLGVGKLKSSATQGLIKQGAGTLAINSTGTGASASVIAGTLNVAAGTVQINKTGTSGATSGDLTAGGLTGSGTVANGANDERWLFINSTGDSTFTGTLANGGTGGLGLNKQGSGTLTLAGTNSYTGTTTVAGGTLAVATKLADTTINVTGGTLSLQTTGAFAPTVAKTITVSGTGDLVQTADNAIGGLAALTAQKSLTLSRPNSYSGDTTINTGTNTTVTITDAAGAGTGRLNAASGATNAIFALHIDGGGTIPMANSFGGNSAVTTTIDVGNNGSGANGNIQLNGIGLWGNGTLNVTGTSGYRLTIAGFNNNAGSAGTALLNPTTASLSLGDYNSTTAFAKTLELGGTTTDNAVTGVISNGAQGTVALTKSNTSTWTLAGNNTYTGNTLITGGTLLVQGSIQGSTAVNVNTGTLGGTGTIGSPLTVGNGVGSLDAILAPGSGIGTLTSTAAVTFQSDAVFSLEINTSTLATDLLTSTGPISLGLGVATLNVANLGSALVNSGQTFTFINGAGGVTGEFAGLPDGAVFSVGANMFEINYTPNSVELIATVPEPASFALLFGGAAMLGMRRLRRRNA